MKILIDSADIKSIEEICSHYMIDGVTTNPTILLKSGKKPYDVLPEIRSLIGKKDLHVQVVSANPAQMKAEAYSIVERLGSDTFIKVPVTYDGVRVIKELSEEGIRCTGTVVYTAQQVLMASNAGALWVAPYVNRIEKTGNNPVSAVESMKKIIDGNGFHTGILGASFHRIDQITAMAELGVDAVTVSSDLLISILDNPTVDGDVSKFTKDFETLCGAGVTMLG